MADELVVFSHLRWTFVWQRPQQLLSRLSRHFTRTWFVEEPEAVEGLSSPILRSETGSHVTRVWLQLPAEWKSWGFDATACEWYSALLAEHLGSAAERTVWLYTPLALDVARLLQPSLVVYDVMDDLAAFRFAPASVALRQRQALREADVVFTGGKSLYRSVLEVRRAGVHCFPSGVEPEHYASAMPLRQARASSPIPVAGYVGVIDERLDLDLIEQVAARLSDWEIRMVGPVLKIEPSSLPRPGNVVYTGPRQYSELPAVLAGFDVALMPFVVNEVTRSISPTKTLEYLASGLPVVSTPVPDVVADYSEIVAIHGDAAAFAQACRSALTESAQSWVPRVTPILQAQQWDAIADRMHALIAPSRPVAGGVVKESA